MDENPYQSPKSVPEVEKPPAKPPSRYSRAALCGFFGTIGPFNWLSSLARFSVLNDAPPYIAFPIVLSMFLIPIPVGLAMARWAWRHPESKWVLPVAFLLGMSGFIPTLIGLLFGLRW